MYITRTKLEILVFQCLSTCILGTRQRWQPCLYLCLPVYQDKGCWDSAAMERVSEAVCRGCTAQCATRCHGLRASALAFLGATSLERSTTFVYSSVLHFVKLYQIDVCPFSSIRLSRPYPTASYASFRRRQWNRCMQTCVKYLWSLTREVAHQKSVLRRYVSVLHSSYNKSLINWIFVRKCTKIQARTCYKMNADDFSYNKENSG